MPRWYRNTAGVMLTRIISGRLKRYKCTENSLVLNPLKMENKIDPAVKESTECSIIKVRPSYQSK